MNIARYPVEISEKLSRAGFTGLGVPEEHGGVVRTFSLACGRSREISLTDAGVAVTRGAHARGHVAHHSLWEREVEGALRAASGATERIGCFTLTEPHSSFFCS